MTLIENSLYSDNDFVKVDSPRTSINYSPVNNKQIIPPRNDMNLEIQKNNIREYYYNKHVNWMNWKESQMHITDHDKRCKLKILLNEAILLSFQNAFKDQMSQSQLSQLNHFWIDILIKSYYEKINNTAYSPEDILVNMSKNFLFLINKPYQYILADAMYNKKRTILNQLHNSGKLFLEDIS